MKLTELAKHFNEDLFLPNLKTKTKDAVLSEMVDHLVTNGHIKNGKLLLKTLLEREKLGSTGIGKSIAIPHSRSLTVEKLIILYARSVKGVNFKSLDDEPVHFFFLIIAPPQDHGNLYLPVLGKIAEIVKEGKIREKLLKVDDFEDFKKAFLRKK